MLPLWELYGLAIYIFPNFLMMKKTTQEGLVSAGGWHHSLQTVSWLIMTMAQSTGCHSLILPREEQEGGREYKK